MRFTIAICTLISVSTIAEGIGRQDKKEIEAFANELKGKRYTTKIYLARYAERNVTRVQQNGIVTYGIFQIKPTFGQIVGRGFDNEKYREYPLALRNFIIQVINSNDWEKRLLDAVDPREMPEYAVIYPPGLKARIKEANFDKRYSCNSCDEFQGHDFEIQLEIFEGVNGEAHFTENVGFILEMDRDINQDDVRQTLDSALEGIDSE